MNRSAIAATLLGLVSSNAYCADLVPCGKNHYILDEPCRVVATSVPIGVPVGIAVNSAGVVHVSSQNIVFRVGSGGFLERVAGNGTPGFAGDGGPAAAALLGTLAVHQELDWLYEGSPFTAHIAFDASDNLYIADSLNDRVRRVDATDGTISTYLGGAAPLTEQRGWTPVYWGIRAPSGIAVDSRGRVHVSASGMILRIPREDGPVEMAIHRRYLASPGALAFDRDDNLFYTEPFCIVRRLTPDGKMTDAVADKECSYVWDDEGRYADRQGIAIDGEGALIIADTSNHCIRRKRAGGKLETIAGTCGLAGEGFSGDGGRAVDARMSQPVTVAVDRAGNVIIGDSGNNRVRMIDRDGTITTIAGNGQQLSR